MSQKQDERRLPSDSTTPSSEYEFAALIQAVPLKDRAAVLSVLQAMASQGKAGPKIEAPKADSPRVTVRYRQSKKAPIAGAVLAVLWGAAYLGWYL